MDQSFHEGSPFRLFGDDREVLVGLFTDDVEWHAPPFAGDSLLSSFNHPHSITLTRNG